jgi:uncharacterized SAM-binding protein YcdF (DUF218 family)
MGMEFVLSKVLWIAFNPGHLLLAVGVVGLIGLFMPPRGIRRAGRWLLASMVLAMGALAVLPAGLWLGPLENRFPPPHSLPAGVDGVIVLSGALDVKRSHRRGRPEMTEAADRVTGLLELAQRYAGAKLVFTGGTDALLDDRHREADFIPNLLDRMGVATGRLILERESRNTHENAVLSKALARPRPGETWLLVTSAFHMPRAVGVFRRSGWEVIPYPVDYRSVGRPDWTSPPDLLRGLAEVSLATKEWVGLIAYRLLGWSDSLFPAPRRRNDASTPASTGTTAAALPVGHACGTRGASRLDTWGYGLGEYQRSRGRTPYLLG